MKFVKASTGDVISENWESYTELVNDLYPRVEFTRGEEGLMTIKNGHEVWMFYSANSDDKEAIEEICKVIIDFDMETDYLIEE